MIARMQTYPKTRNQSDVRVVQLQDKSNLFFTDVQVCGEYPKYLNRYFKENGIELSMEPEDEAEIKKGTVDHLGFSCYMSTVTSDESSPNLCVKYFSQAQVVQGMRMHPCLSTITLEGAVKGAPSAHLEEVPLTASERVIHLTQLLVFVVPLPILLVQQPS